MLVDIFDAAPIWVWFAFSFLLGLASYWLYRICALREFRSTRDSALEEWRVKLKDAEGRILGLQTTLAARDAALANAAQLKADAALGAQAKPALEAAEEEVRRLKYELWVLQTRLSRVGVLRSDAESRASERDASSLRYQLWMAQNRLARATSRLEPVRPEAAGPIRLAAAADVDGAGLRYRNWLLAQQLSGVVAAEKARAPLDLAAIQGALIEAEAERPESSAILAGPPPQEIIQEPSQEMLTASEAEAAKLRNENSGLRYRNWRFATGVGEAIAALRGGVEPSESALEQTLSDAGVVEFAPEEAEEAAAELGQSLMTIAPVIHRGVSAESPSLNSMELQAAKASAETLRWRVFELEAASHDLAIEASSARSARAEAVETRRRLWAAEWKRRREAVAPAPAPVAPPLHVDPAAIDEAAALRRRAGQAEAALRALRGDLSRAEASALSFSKEIQHQRMSIGQTASDEAAALRRRASQAEAALRSLRAELAKAESAQRGQATAAAKVQQAQVEAASTRSQLWSAEWRAQKVDGGAVAAFAFAPVEEVAVQAPPELPMKPPVPLKSVAPPPSHELAPPSPVDFTAPLSGVESAALELIGTDVQPGPPLLRPAMLLNAPANGGGDDLRLIHNIDTPLLQRLNASGVHQFDQIAFARPEELAWIDTQLDLGAKVVRDRWAPQANYWAALKRAGALALGKDGLWTKGEIGSSGVAADPAVQAAPGAVEAGQAETIASLPAPRFVENVTQPLSGAEAAALEIIDAGATPRTSTPPTLSLLSKPSIGEPDDLTLIRGLGPRLRAVLNELGVYYFAQIADLSPPDIAWLDAKLAFAGRLVRDRWIPQARVWRERKALGRLELNAEGFLTALKAPAPDEEDMSASGGGGRADAPIVKPVPRHSDSASSTGAVVMTAPRAAVEVMTVSSSPDADAVEAARRALKSAAEPTMLERSAALPPNINNAPLTHAERDAAQLIEAGLGDRPSSRPLSLLDGPLAGPVDDLTQIMGVGSQLAEQLNALGLYYYRQLTQFSGADLAWLDSALQLEGRLLRERWVVQAEELERRRLYG